MNLALYGLEGSGKRRWIAVDMGVSFAGNDLPGVDAILPDISYLEQRRGQLDGIVITHAHEDHFGALFDYGPRLGAPIYMTPFAATLLAAKAAGEAEAPDLPVSIIEQGSRIEVGAFDIEFVSMSHSIPEPNALVIRAGGHVVVHSGDWKLDPEPIVGRPTDEVRLRQIGDEGVTALICDSTNAIREGASPSESEVAEVLAELIENAEKRVIVTCFASNVARIRSVAEAAIKAERRVVLVGRAMRRIVDVADEMGYLEGLPPFLDQDTYQKIPRSQVVALMTGSQGEPRAALARAAGGNNRALPIDRGDRVIFSSRAIPGNERPINAIINKLVDNGVEVITDRDGLVHVSGHPRRDELRQLYEWIRPQVLVPVHGEALHLHEHAKFAVNRGITHVVEVRNGDVVRLDPDRPEIVDSVTAGRVYRDGKLILSHEQSGVSARRKLANSGHVAVSIVLDRDYRIVEEPVVSTVGLPEADGNGDDIVSIIEEKVDQALEAMPRSRRSSDSRIRDVISQGIRKEIETVWGKRPLVTVLISRLDDAHA